MLPFINKADVDDPKDVAIATGTTVDVSDVVTKSPAPKKDVATKLTSAIVKQDVEIKGDGRVSASTDSPYGIELLISDGQNFPPTKKDFLANPSRVKKVNFNKGFAALAELTPGEFYAIKVYNDSEFDAAVEIHIDGLSSFEFTDIQQYRETNYWIVPRRSSGVIYGWHRTNQHSDSL